MFEGMEIGGGVDAAAEWNGERSRWRDLERINTSGSIHAGTTIIQGVFSNVLKLN